MNSRYLFLFLLAAFLTVSCGHKALTRKYYVLEVQNFNPNNSAETKFQYDYKVDVRDFHVARAYDQSRIAVRTASNEMNYYYYHHWAAKPTYAVTDLVFDLIEQQKLFTRCARGITYNPDYIIFAQVKSFERIQKNKMAEAHVHILFNFLDASTEIPVVQFEADRYAILQPDLKMNTFAQTISQVISEMTHEFVTKVLEYLQEKANRENEG